MKALLVRRWFLLVILIGAAVVWLWPAALAWTAYLNPGLCAALAIFLSACSLESKRLVRALVRPLPALLAAFISFGFLPALAWQASRLLPQVDMQIGMVLIASVPCTLTSAILWTRLAGGNDSVALLVTLLTNAFGWLFTTAWLLLAVGAGPGPLPALDMMLGLFLVLVVPVGLGQLFRAAGPLARTANRQRAVLSVLARILTVSIMLQAAMVVRGRLEEQTVSLEGWVVVLAATLCLGSHLGALAAGMWSGRALGLARPEWIAVAIAGSQKTLPVALVLFDAYFRAYPLAILSLVFFHLGQLVVDTFIAEHWAGPRPRQPAPVPPEEIAAEAVL